MDKKRQITSTDEEVEEKSASGQKSKSKMQNKPDSREKDSASFEDYFR